MILLRDVIFSDDVREKKFVCNLSACKGACCVEGEAGAPLEDEEKLLLEENIEAIIPFLTPQGKEAIAEQGISVFEDDDDYTGYGTPLIGREGACAYVNFDQKGVAYCGIEKAWEEGRSSMRKPVSCHLYPLRITEYEGFTAVNYEVWEICEEACRLGSKLQVPVYKFVREGLVRKFGNEFYQELEEMMQALGER